MTQRYVTMDELLLNRRVRVGKNRGTVGAWVANRHADCFGDFEITVKFDNGTEGIFDAQDVEFELPYAESEGQS